MSSEILTFHKQPILKLQSDTIKYLNLFIGYKKAKLILENILVIEEFVKSTEGTR